MEWILCHLKLPEENKEVLLTFKNSAGLHVGVATFKKNAFYYIAETSNESYEEIYGVPIAWIEMPKPLSYF